jgi:hypothetical protein
MPLPAGTGEAEPDAPLEEAGAQESEGRSPFQPG